MAILGIGIDIVHVPRFLALLKRRCPRRMASRILSDEEASVWNAIPESDAQIRIRFLSVRWAVKEAAYKALYPAAKPTWKELTYRSLGSKPGPKPSLIYMPSSTKIGRIHVSVSHDGDYVLAQVLVEESNV